MLGRRRYLKRWGELPGAGAGAGEDSEGRCCCFCSPLGTVVEEGGIE